MRLDERIEAEFMGIKFSPGLKAAGIDPSVIQKLIDVQKIPVETAKKRKDAVQTEKKEVEKLVTLLGDLSTSINTLKTRSDFHKLKMDSSHPDIIDGNAGPGANLGSYEFEVRSLARSEKELAIGFPDKDESPVGFGYMQIRRDDGEEFEIVIDPGMTLNQVAEKINEAGAGVKAMVINTKYEPEPFRLLVTSDKSGKESQIFIDPDTTYLEFNKQVKGRNLDVLFEDVPITDTKNVINDLIDSVSLNIRRAEPGTRVQVNIVNDLEATMKEIKTFVEKYNAVAGFINGQYVQNPETGKFGLLSADSSLKYILRELQSSLFTKGSGKFSTLSEIGITTNPKGGQLVMDDAKVKKALNENYESVADIFVRNANSNGVAGAMEDKLKNFRDPGFGAIKSKMRSLDKVIQGQDKEIEMRQRQLEVNEKNITRKFANLESTLGELQGQSDFLKSRFGGEHK